MSVYECIVCLLPRGFRFALSLLSTIVTTVESSRALRSTPSSDVRSFTLGNCRDERQGRVG